MRIALLPVLLAVSACSKLLPQASDGPPPQITGVWAVTMTWQDSSCPDVIGGSKAAMWTVNQDGQGAYTVGVQGDEKLPSLTGAAEGGAVVLTGVESGLESYSGQWRLTGNATTLRGRAIQTRKAKDALVVQTAYGERKRDLTCAVVWTVEAKKQG